MAKPSPFLDRIRIGEVEFPSPPTCRTCVCDILLLYTIRSIESSAAFSLGITRPRGEEANIDFPCICVFAGRTEARYPFHPYAPRHISWRWHQPNPRSDIESQHQPATPTDGFLFSISRDLLSAQAEKRVCTPRHYMRGSNGCNMTWRLGGTMPTYLCCAALHALGHDSGLRNRAEP